MESISDIPITYKTEIRNHLLNRDQEVLSATMDKTSKIKAMT